jgi:RNA polymerase sigma factor (sigma-70 family)
MSSQRLAVCDLGLILKGESVSGLSEWQLLERYVERRDEVAFEALVTRHGPMVLGVCRRILGVSEEAEDAFQATFLVLLRRARDLGPRDAIGPWLYGVATRVASRARVRVERHRRVQTIPPEFAVADRTGAAIDPDLVEILDQELGRLPGKYRSPLVLCYLEGRTHEEAARDLQWPLGTVKGRLSRARELLRSRLARRGLTPSAGIGGILASPDLRIVLERPLVSRTVGASARLAAGQTIAQVVPQSITSLVEGVLANMFLAKMKWAALAAVAAGFAFTSAAVLGRQDAEPKPVEPQASGKRVPGPSDSLLLPGNVLEKEGPVREKMGKRQNAAYGQQPQPIRAGDIVEQQDGRSMDPRSRQILAKLDEPLAMNFETETPLDDILKYIKQGTTTPTFPGIPIYVEPEGLQKAERSLNSTVQINLEGVPLRRTLQLALDQLGLAYFVQDGFVIITSKERASEPLPPVMPKPARIYEMFDKAERGEMTSTELKELIEVIRLRRVLKQMRETYNGKGGAFGGEPVFPGEEAAKDAKELLKEVRELIRLLKAEKQGTNPAQTKARTQ